MSNETFRRSLLTGLLIFLGSVWATAQTATQVNIPQVNADSSVIDAEGTAHVTRVVPVPSTISDEARASLSRAVSDAPHHTSLAERRAGTDAWQARAGAAFEQIYPVTITPDTIAGVPVKIVTPQTLSKETPERILINLHGGGFNSDSGSLTETVPVAALSHLKVVAVLYRLAPEHPFPAGLEDAIAVYKELLKTHAHQNIGMFGTSAGAILTGEVAVRLQQLNLPLPGALGIFSGAGDFAHFGDSQSIYALDGFSGPLSVPSSTTPDSEYARSTDLHDPVLSPVYADLHGMPPTLFLTSTRDLLLSGTTILHRAFLRAGNPAELVVFEALPHAFWNDANLPESKEADEIMAGFFTRHLFTATRHN